MSAMSSSEGRGQPMILCADFMTLCRAFFRLLNSLNTTLRDSEKMHCHTVVENNHQLHTWVVLFLGVTDVSVTFCIVAVV